MRETLHEILNQLTIAQGNLVASKRSLMKNKSADMEDIVQKLNKVEDSIEKIVDHCKDMRDEIISRELE